MSAGTLIKVGDVWIDPMHVEAIQPSRRWSLDDGQYAIDPMTTRVSLSGRSSDIDVHGITPEAAALIINAAIAEQEAF